MESVDDFYSVDEFKLDPKWWIDPKHLFVGPRIGEGAHAKVYEGKYKNQTVAIKIGHKGDTPEEISKREVRFAREVAMLSKVQHKNLAKFIGACKEPVMVIVTELLLGGTLRKYLLNMRPICLEMHVVIGFALDIARAIECLHSHGIIHRDLKPENLILTADQKTVKLVDFGLAREESLTEMMTAETGTYRWMAPELYSTVTLRHGDKKHYNHKVDAYSFAIVLWELLHNKVPFEGMSNLQAAYAAAFKNVRPCLDDLPEEVAVILGSCWREDPNTRPNFTKIVEMLLDYLCTIFPPERMIPSRIFASESAMMAPESPGTSSLIPIHDDTDETPRAEMEDIPKAMAAYLYYPVIEHTKMHRRPIYNSGHYTIIPYEYHEHVSTIQGTPGVLPDVSRYMETHMMFNKPSFYEEEREPFHQQFQHHQNVEAHAAPHMRVHFVEKQKMPKSHKHKESEEMNANVDAEADGFIRQRHKNFDLAKWGTFK